MTIEQIILNIISGDEQKMREACTHIISFYRDKEKIISLKNYKHIIKDKIDNIGFWGDSRHLNHVLTILDFYLNKNNCPCFLYIDKHGNYDPNKEAERKYIRINNVLINENNWIEGYDSTCLNCNQNFKILELEHHSKFWKWNKIETKLINDEAK